MTTKICTKCKVEKPKTEFSKHPKTRDGLTSWCKLCTNGAAKKTRRANKLKNANGVDVTGTKFCVKCKEEKPKVEFYKHPSSRDGLRSWCKSCERAADKETRRANKLKHVRGVDTAGTKVCSQCREEKKRTEFSVTLDSHDGLRAYCKECESYYRHARTERDRYVNKTARTRREDIRAAEKYCPACGETKSIDDFYKCVTCKNGLNAYCKACSRQRDKSYRNHRNMMSSALATRAGDRWSSEDDQFVITRCGTMTQYQMAVELGRTLCSVNQRIHRLRQDGKLT